MQPTNVAIPFKLLLFVVMDGWSTLIHGLVLTYKRPRSEIDMNLDALTGVTAQGMLLCLYCSLPVVIVAAAVGLAVSFFQANTSLQDQTLRHGVKLSRSS